MKTVIKSLIFLCFTFFSVYNAQASNVNDSTTVSTIHLRPKGDGHPGDKHLPHKSPIKNGDLPNVYYDLCENTLTFANPEVISFTYNVYDMRDNVVCSDVVIIDEECQEITITIPYRDTYEYALEIVINEQTYIGYFETK